MMKFKFFVAILLALIPNITECAPNAFSDSYNKFHTTYVAPFSRKMPAPVKDFTRGFTDTFSRGLGIITLGLVGGTLMTKTMTLSGQGPLVNPDLPQDTAQLTRAVINTGFTLAAGGAGASAMAKQMKSELDAPVPPVLYTIDRYGEFVGIKEDLLLKPALPGTYIQGPAAGIVHNLRRDAALLAENPQQSDFAGVLGALLYGEPGVGKTFAAQIFTRELSEITHATSTVNPRFREKEPVLIRIKESSLSNPYVGQSSKLRDQLVKDLKFLNEKGYTPVLLFDEADRFFGSEEGSFIRHSGMADTGVSGWKDRLEKDLAPHCVIVGASNSSKLDAAIMDRFPHKADVTPKNIEEKRAIIRQIAHNIVQQELRTDETLGEFGAYLEKNAIDLAEKMVKSGKSQKDDLPNGRTFKEQFGRIVHTAKREAIIYSENGIPVRDTELAPQSTISNIGKQEIASTVPQQEIFKNISDRALVRLELRSQVPDQASHAYIRKKLSERYKKMPLSEVDERATELTNAVEWALSDKNSGFLARKTFFDTCFSNIANDEKLADDATLPIVLRIVGMSGKTFPKDPKDLAANQKDPFLTLLRAYHGFPQENDALNMIKNLTIIPHIEAAEAETGSDGFKAKAQEVRNEIIKKPEALSAVASMTLKNASQSYQNIRPEGKFDRKLTAPMYRGSSIITADSIGRFYTHAAGGKAPTGGWNFVAQD